MEKKPFVVLMAEDSEHDIIATKRAWKKNNIRSPLTIVKDGEACLDYLHRRGEYTSLKDAPKPGLLLLDIRMPKLNGLEVLEQIRQDSEYQSLPVIMLTTSRQEEDRIKSYKLGANAYIVKPVDFLNFSEAIKTINLFWELVELPSV